jgi:hypothetical protein
VVQPINTIHSDADIRIAQRTKAARLAAGLMAAPLASTNIQEAPDAGMFPGGDDRQTRTAAMR